MGLDVMIFIFWMLSFKPAFSLSFTFIKRLFSSSSLSVIRVVSLYVWNCWYFSQQSWCQFVAQQAWHFAWCTQYCKLNKHGDSIQPWRTPFPIWNQPIVPCSVLTVASWPAYRLLRRQVGGVLFLSLLRIFHSLLLFTQRL